MRYLIRRACAAVLAGALLVLGVSAALAHAQLRHTEPAANAVLPTAPLEAVLGFNEAVTALAIGLVAPDARRTDLTSAAESGEEVRIALPAGLAAGTYALSWRVASIDGHPVSGTLVFSVGRATATASATPQESDLGLLATIWGLRAALLASLAFGVGGAVFGLFVPLPRVSRRFAIAACGAGFVATIAGLGTQGLDALGLGFSDLPTARPWAAALGTTYAATAASAGLALLLALAALRVPRLRSLAAPAWLLAGLAPAVSGHAGSAEPQVIMRLVVAGHVSALLFWIGALGPLLVLLRRAPADSAEALAQFSRIVPCMVLTLLGSGAILASVQLGWPGPNWLSSYGAILAAKLALLVLLFGLAAWNRFALTGAVLAGSPTASRRLAISIRIEIAVVLVVFALVAGWRFTPPPRALAGDRTIDPVFVHVMNGALMANITISPGRAGPSDIDIALIDALETPVAAQAVTLALSAPALGIEPFAAQARANGASWRADAVTIPMPGTWHLLVTVRLGRFEQSRLETQFELPGD